MFDIRVEEPFFSGTPSIHLYRLCMEGVVACAVGDDTFIVGPKTEKYSKILGNSVHLNNPLPLALALLFAASSENC